MNKNKLLFVEDDVFLGQLLSDYLRNAGFEVKHCMDGRSGFQQIVYDHYDLCILDVMLPDGEGFALAKKIKEQKEQQAILFLTARSLKQDKLRGFSAGADDYVTKPFDEEELLCRIKAILRRQKMRFQNQETLFKIGAYQFDSTEQKLIYRGEAEDLTTKESKILRLLCAHKNKVLRREVALHAVYGKSDYFLGRSFDVFISKLRKKLEKDPSVCIENVFKVGFRLRID